jgi:hypothetical protein
MDHVLLKPCLDTLCVGAGCRRSDHLRLGRKADDVCAGVGDEKQHSPLVRSVNALRKCTGLGGRRRDERNYEANKQRAQHRNTPGCRRTFIPQVSQPGALACLDRTDHVFYLARSQSNSSRTSVPAVESAVENDISVPHW